jgi:hypothetical protein
MYFKFAVGVYWRYLVIALFLMLLYTIIANYERGFFPNISTYLGQFAAGSLLFLVFATIPSVLGGLLFYLFLEKTLYEDDFNDDKVQRLLKILKLNFYTHLCFWALSYLPWRAVIDNTPATHYLIFALTQFAISCFAVAWQNTVTPNNFD